jgi:hypothetical protein
MYDLLGRELNEVKIGTMYIQNQKLIIKQWKIAQKKNRDYQWLY